MLLKLMTIILQEIKMEKNIKYFIFVTLLPIIGIFVIFIYSFLYIANEIEFTQKEILGLKGINSVQSVILEIESARGNLSEFKANDLNKKIKLLKENIESSAEVYKNSESYIKKLDDIEQDKLKNKTFDEITEIIEQNIKFLQQISYDSNLILDPEHKTYTIMNLIVNVFPDLLECNNKMISNSFSKNINIETFSSKIDELIGMIKFNLDQLCIDNRSQDCSEKKAFEELLKGERSILVLVKKGEKDSALLSQRLNSNINVAKKLYFKNSILLKTLLEKRINEKYNIQFWIVVLAILSIIFILYTNLLFYNKNKEFINKIKELSIKDSMTDLYNRRYFETIFIKELNRTKRYEHDFIFIIIDIDYFKQYNDTYGHQAGDEVIKKISSALQRIFKRSTDIVFRLGGEEFGIICVDVEEKDILSLSERLRSFIHHLKIEHKKSDVCDVVTVSGGLSVIKPYYKYSKDQIYKFTDDALYEAKSSGRDKIVQFDYDNIAN